MGATRPPNTIEGLSIRSGLRFAVMSLLGDVLECVREFKMPPRGERDNAHSTGRSVTIQHKSLPQVW
jgi:hypothetical protein